LLIGAGLSFIMKGYFKIHRKILDSQVFAHQTALKIWVWCLAKATYKERFVSVKVSRGETTVKIEPGQFVFGRFKAEDELNIDGSTIYKWIQKFASPDFGMIKIKSSNQYSIISICNWDDYQNNEDSEVTAEEQPCNNGVTTEEQPCNTNNKDNKVKKYIYNQFYDLEIEKSNNDENYIKVVKILFGENNLALPLKSVLKMPEQLSYEQSKRIIFLKSKYKFSISATLEEMENWNDIKKRKTVFRTFLTFIKRRYPNISET
jgi:hypothetical protein